ncbi:phage tail tape measure protein [Halopseudomonas phragmitis]|uniref:Phage tail tape measure protein n=1 Tax=Halopseudomonas phragmitis TaxID=1931241 RepID=A0A1V0B679_9GAMM|nr:phage tail tape measure protein [Halopseudomonas phragmitis]AQZ95453.1 phage tail tape measure protein [Halopseudomonas phragmitis]
MAQQLRLEVVLQALDRATKPIRAIAQGSVGLGQDLKNTRDQLKQLQAQQKDISSFRSLRTANEQTGQALAASRDRVRELSRQMAETTNPTKQLSNEFKRAVRESQALKQKHGEQQRELQGLRGKLGEAGISTRNLGEHERELKQRLASTNTTLKQQEDRLRSVTQQQKRLADAKRQYEKTQALAGSMAATGAAGVATGTGILYSGARLLAPGVEFDADMGRVRALARLEAGSEELAALRAQARQLGANTSFSANEAAQGQGFLAMAGFTPQAIRDAMPAMLDVAKAGAMDLAQTADITSNILTGFNLQSADTARVGDVLTAAFTRSNTSLHMLGETMKYAAPNAAAYGQDIETMAAAAGKLGDAGIQGSMAGTAMRAILSRLAGPPKKAAAALEQLNIQVRDAQGNMLPLPNILRQIHDSTENLGNTERGALLKAIAGEEAGSALTVLTQQAGSGELQTLIEQLREAQGEAARTAAVMGDNLGGDMASLRSVWADLGIGMQELINEEMRDTVKGLVGIIRRVREWMAENPELTKQIIKTIAGLGILITGFGALTIALASIIGPFAMIRYGLTFFGIKAVSIIPILKGIGGAFLWLGKAMLANPIGIAIGLLVLAGYLLYKNWDGVIGGLKALWQGLVTAARAIWGALVTFFTGIWQEISTAFDGGMLGIAKLLINWSPLGLLWRGITSALSALGIQVPEHFKTLGSAMIDGLLNGLKASMGKLKDGIMNVGGAVTGWFKDKLNINSPSRVFAELGGYTMQGLAQGINREQREPLEAVAAVADRIASTQALTDGIQFDNRRPLAARPVATAATSSNSYEIHIHPAPGMDAQAIGRAVAAELDRRERERAARGRSALYDQE